VSGSMGFPFRAGELEGKNAAITLTGVAHEMQRTALPPKGFNHSLTVLPPKGSEPGDADRVVRKAEDTRPLSLKNSDNKTVAGVTNDKLAGVVAKWSNKAQRGFVRGRQGLQIIVEVDTYARLADMLSQPGLLALMIFFDFAAAFPSIAHAWLFLAMRYMGCPAKVLNFVKALYHDNKGFIHINRVIRDFCLFLSGVLQGCPLSETLFVISINPFLNAAENILNPPYEIMRAFADDLAAVLQSLAQLKRLQVLFKVLHIISGLSIKAKKCVIIPLGEVFCPDVAARVREYLVRHVPAWRDFKICDRGCYLGLVLGPGSANHSWDVPSEKWVFRSVSLATSKLSPALGLSEYNIRAFPTLSYPAQLLPPTKKMLRDEKSSPRGQ